jgi:DNA (cytosine-5)-methyltransferase 1
MKKTQKKPEGVAPTAIARIRAGVEEHWIKPFNVPVHPRGQAAQGPP